MTDIETLKNMIDESENVVFFGGAGVSTESGIPDFRGKDGLYKKKYDVDPEYLLSVECFEDHPDWFWDFYRNKILIDGVKPNDAHYALVKLEESGKLKAIITQNIDNLHELAGSKKIYHIHGTINTCHCPYCGKTFTLDEIKKMPLVPRCDCGLTDNYIENKLKEYKQSGKIKKASELERKINEGKQVIEPDIVLYGEPLPRKVWNDARAAVADADLLIVAGTSLSVYPANTLVTEFQGKNLIIINDEATNCDEYADLVIHDSIGKTLKEAIE